MKRFAFYILLVTLLHVFASQSLHAQVSLNGPTTVVVGGSAMYSTSNGQTPSSWSVSCGTWSPSGSSVQIHFPISGYTSCTIVANGSGWTASALVTIAPALTGGTITTAAQTINYNTTPGLISASAPGGGACGGGYTYQWGASPTSTGFFTPISGATGATFQSAPLTTTTYFQRTTSCSGMQSTTTNTVGVTVLPQLTASITPGSQTINYNASPTAMSVTPSGGNGTYTYNWHSCATQNGTYSPAGSTTNSLAPGNLTSTMYYEVTVSSNGVSATSSPVAVTVYSQIIGYVSGTNPVAYNTSPGVIQLTGVSGGNGYYTYQWQSSSDPSFSSPQNIGNGTTSYTAPALTTTTYYRVIITSNGATDIPAFLTVTVLPPLTGGSIAGPSTLLPYFGTASLTSTQAAQNGNCFGQYSYEWWVSTDGTNYTFVSSGTSTTYSQAITGPTYFKRKSICSAETVWSNVVYVQTRPQLLPGTIMPVTQTIPAGTTPLQLTANAAVGGAGGTYTYSWQQSTDSSNFSTVASGAANLNYAPGTLSVKTYYRRMVTCGPDVAYTNISAVYIGTSPPVADMNYVRVRDIKKPGVLDTASARLLTDPGDVNQTTQYIDGLGRLIQTVSKQGTPGLKDLVAPVQYDSYGRETASFLPYVSISNDGNYQPDALREQNAFNSNQFPNEQFYYGQTNFEPSPLNRPLLAAAPGLNWTGSSRGVSTVYLINEAADSVKIWTIADAAGSIPVTTAYYQPATLYKNVTTDEQGNQVVEYKDVEGHVILKKVQLWNVPAPGHSGWLCTYYIYDDAGNLRFVIQPRAVELINPGWVISQAIADELCFRYEYDLRHRMIIKKVPGAGEAWMIYDQWDRVVLTQDANLRATNQWVFLKYDVLDRPILKGFYTNTTYTTQSAMQAYLTGQNMGRYENYQTVSFPLYSYNQTFPVITTSNLLTVTYYDDYSWGYWYGWSATKDNTYDGHFLTASNSTYPYPQALTQSSATRGLVTFVADYTSQTVPVGTETFYDDHSRVVQTIYQDGRGKDITTRQYDFSGKPLESYVKAQDSYATPQNHYIQTKMDYDAGGRLLHIYKNIDSAASDQLISTLQYNELGQLQTKTLGNSLDNLAYDYNIRGWLTGINKSYLGSSTNSNYFGMELGYDKTTTTATTIGTAYKGFQYNGNIAGTIWKSAGDGVNRQYDFSYDNVNRLTGADFNQQFGSVWQKASPSNPSFTMDFSVGNLTYDANGNIKSMKQSGFKIGGSGPIDDLKYNYKSIGNSNRLAAVYDSRNDVASKLGDFHFSGTKNPTDTLDYTYDGNGNLTSDNNKGISSIIYNYLNLPTKIIFSGSRIIYYNYDDAGNKLMKIVTDPSSSPALRVETRYISGLVYQNDTLSYIPTEEGRARWAFHKYYTGGGTGYKYEYDFAEKDHLGNTRVLLSQEKDTALYIATMEAAYRTTEKALFYNVDSCSYAASLVPGGYPADGTTNPNDSVARVNGTLHKMGPAILLKMMSGDSVSFGVKSFYRSGGTVGSPNSSFTSVLNALAGGLITMTGGSHGALTDLTNPATTPVYNEISNFISTRNTVIPSKPKSYLNWMLLDNQFNYVSNGGQSGAMGIGAPDVLNPLKGHFKLKNNGYLYIWVSNETPNWDVFFDNLSIQTFTGPMLEENHYYPFGLTMAGINDKALKTNYAENKYRYNGGNELQNKEFADGSGLELYDAVHRMYDPQIGRFGQIDELGEVTNSWSPYSYSYNNAVNFNDPLGLLSDPDHPEELATVVVTAKHTTQNLQNTYWDLTARGVSFDRVKDKGLRNWLHNYDAQQKYIQTVHSQIREQGLLAVDVGSYFIPVPLGELKIAGTLGSLALKLFKLKRGLQEIEIGTHLVYQGVDKSTGLVKYIGITGREATERFAEHLNATGTGKELLDYSVINGATGLSKTEARVWEQKLINQYGLGKDGGQLLNKINSIAEKNWESFGITK